jgi:NAD(P)-dependent dehydrogenase (short-subunit alcohol dehydrogenase family)
MNLELHGKTALVTGGSRGIGRAVALALAAEGCRLHLASRGQADLERTRDEIVRAHGVTVDVHALDLGDGDALRVLAGSLGAVDILVNNAGAIPGGRIDQIDDATWKKAWDLKVFGTIGLCREMLAAMQARGQGVIVNVIGMAGERPDANYLAGSGANAALMAMTRALGAASVEHGVRVVGVNPGLVATDRMVGLLRAKAANTMGDAERWSELVHGYPFGRPAHPGEIADMVCFLASARAAYVSGTIVTVDGGVAARGASF